MAVLNILYRLWNLIYPPKCVLCRTVLPKECSDLCPACRRDAPEFIYSKKHTNNHSECEKGF